MNIAWNLSTFSFISDTLNYTKQRINADLLKSDETVLLFLCKKGTLCQVSQRFWPWKCIKSVPSELNNTFPVWAEQSILALCLFLADIPIPWTNDNLSAMTLQWFFVNVLWFLNWFFSTFTATKLKWMNLIELNIIYYITYFIILLIYNRFQLKFLKSANIFDFYWQLLCFPNSHCIARHLILPQIKFYSNQTLEWS